MYWNIAPTRLHAYKTHVDTYKTDVDINKTDIDTYTDEYTCKFKKNADEYIDFCIVCFVRWKLSFVTTGLNFAPSISKRQQQRHIIVANYCEMDKTDKTHAANPKIQL